MMGDEWRTWYRGLKVGDEIAVVVGSNNPVKIFTEVARVNAKSITAKCPDCRFDANGRCVGPGRHTSIIRLSRPSKISLDVA